MGGVYGTLSSNAAHSHSILEMVLQFFGDRSLALAPGSWIFVGGLWIWRGRMKSRWEALGFDSEVFELFVRMRGGKTRVKLLNSLLIPKDRFQLAQELGLDWKGVDRHVVMLNKYGFVHEQAAYGRVEDLRADGGREAAAATAAEPRPGGERRGRPAHGGDSST